MDGGAETCSLGGLDENTFPCPGRSDSEFPFPSMHLPWLSIKFCLFTAFSLSFLLILSFLSSSWFMPVAVASGFFPWALHPFSALQKYV